MRRISIGSALQVAMQAILPIGEQQMPQTAKLLEALEFQEALIESFSTTTATITSPLTPTCR
jgi:hypothetical protein